MNRDGLLAFIRESNAIEREYHEPERDLPAHTELLAVSVLTVAALEAFVNDVAGAMLRRFPNLNVRVGDYIAPRGGQEVVDALQVLIDRANRGDDPYAVHLVYETLHPFTDGNGRSGRALWLRMMIRQGRWIAPMGFLQSFYYQTLSAIPERTPETSDTPAASKEDA